MRLRCRPLTWVWLEELAGFVPRVIVPFGQHGGFPWLRLLGPLRSWRRRPARLGQGLHAAARRVGPRQHLFKGRPDCTGPACRATPRRAGAGARELRQRPPRRNLRRPLPTPVVVRGRLGAPSHLDDLGKPHTSKSWQDCPSELLRVVDGPGIGLVPTPTAPDVGDDGTRLAWPLHEPTELPVGEARQGTEQRPCARAGRRKRRARFGRDPYPLSQQVPLCRTAGKTTPCRRRTILRRTGPPPAGGARRFSRFTWTYLHIWV